MGRKVQARRTCQAWSNRCVIGCWLWRLERSYIECSQLWYADGKMMLNSVIDMWKLLTPIHTLQIIAAARRLYRPTSSHKLRLDQVVELNRRFLLGYKHFENDPRLIELARKVQAYNNMLKYFGIRDHQVERTGTTRTSAAKLLLYRLVKLICLSALGFPS